MPDYGGDFDIPETLPVPGSTTVMGWSDIRVLINKLPLENVENFEVTRDINIGPGTCTLTVSDPNRYIYSIFQASDEIEIYVQSKLDPTIGLKIWGGYIDNMTFDINGGHRLKLSGKEYISRLQSQTQTLNIPTLTDLGTVIKTNIMSIQTDFTTEAIPDVMGYLTTANVTNEPIYGILKQLCDQFSLYFWIDPTTKDLNARFKDTVVETPDSILADTNFLRGSKVSKNSEYLTNQVVVGVDGAISSTISDATSQLNYGVYSRSVTAGGLADVVSGDQYATSLVTSKKAQLDSYEIESLMIPYTDPGEFIYLDLPVFDLVGFYQVVNVVHKWALGSGVTTVIQTGAQLPDTYTYISDLEGRLRTVEKKAFT